MIVQNWHVRGRRANKHVCLLRFANKASCGRAFEMLAIRDADERFLNLRLTTAECRELSDRLTRHLDQDDSQ